MSYHGKKILKQSGIVPVSAAHPLHFEHDDTIINFLLSLGQKNLIQNSYLSEKVLRQLPASKVIDAIGQSPEKLPDLVFELKLTNLNFKIALEVERTRKSKPRYDHWIQSYAKAEKLNLIILAYNDHSVFQTIQGAIKFYQYPQHLRPIAFCKIQELLKNWTNFPTYINGINIPFETYIENLNRISQIPQTKSSDFQSEPLSDLVQEVHWR